MKVTGKELTAGLSRSLWTYAYRIAPPPPRTQLKTIKTLLDRENSVARARARTWTGRIVLERQITHLLIVSDSPDQHREINHRLEAELQNLHADFAVTEPMAILRPGGGIALLHGFGGYRDGHVNGNGNGNGNGKRM